MKSRLSRDFAILDLTKRLFASKIRILVSGVSYTGSRLIGDSPRRRVSMVWDNKNLMWYIYILESLKNERLYIGYTENLKRRFEEHNGGRGGEYTKRNGKWRIIFYEAYLEKKDAAKAEKFFKTGYGREVLKNKLENYFKNKK